MPFYLIDIEFGQQIKVIKAKNKDQAIWDADIPIGAAFTIGKVKRENITKEFITLFDKKETLQTEIEMIERKLEETIK